MSRDPRINPQPGDVLKPQNTKLPRRVIRRDGYSVHYETVGEKPRRLCCWITTWQDWCKYNSASPPPDQGEGK